jgi:hypothetical protein
VFVDAVGTGGFADVDRKVNVERAVTAEVDCLGTVEPRHVVILCGQGSEVLEPV